jgi:ERCC4-type nuclease
METSPTLVLDTREAGLAAALTGLGVPFRVEPLSAGDFWIVSADGEPLLVAERKTFADFAASNTDGRYREQRARLMAMRGAGAAVLYVLEGSWSVGETRAWGAASHPMTEPTMKRLLARLTLRYGMPVLAADNTTATAQWCRVLLAQLRDDPKVFHPESGSIAESTAGAMTAYTAALSPVKAANRTAGAVAAAMLGAIPGLGEKRVAAILAERSVAGLAAMTAAEIAALAPGGRRLGDKLGAAIAEALQAKAG